MAWWEMLAVAVPVVGMVALVGYLASAFGVVPKSKSNRRTDNEHDFPIGCGLPAFHVCADNYA